MTQPGNEHEASEQPVLPVCEEEIVEFDVPTEFGPLPAPEEEPEPVVVEVRRRAGLAGLLGVLAAGVATLYLSRAVGDGGVLSWALFAAFGLVAVAYLAVLVDSRTPLLVADDHGLRLRLGRSWTGLTWGSLRRVEVTAREGLRDGRLVVTPRDEDRLLAELDAGGRRAAWLARRLYGSPFTVPLSLATRVVGTDDVLAALRELAARRADVVDKLLLRDEDVLQDPGAPEDVDGGHHFPDPRPKVAHGISLLAARLRSRSSAASGSSGSVDEGPMLPDPVVASATPSPLRELVTGRRTEVSRDLPSELVSGANALKADLSSDDFSTAHALPEAMVLRRPGAVDFEIEEETWGSYGESVRPVAVPGEALETIVIEDFAIEPAVEPVIGPEFAAARTRLGLSVDQVAERTRIRPHVIESIEVDDFVPCGGDFYARGHVRTLARVLGVDAAPLLASYDERYADAPVNPRRVFEAELAHSGGIRATRGGPNWSVLVAAVMALVLAWSIARLVMDGPVDLRDEPALNGSGGPNHRAAPLAAAVPVVISAPGGGARVIVRDGGGSVVFTGDIAFGGTKTLSVSPPVRVQSTDGSVTVSVDGQSHGPLGSAGSPGSGTFVAR